MHFMAQSASICHFQTVTICNGFIAFGHETLFHHPPIDLRVRAIGQNVDHIDDREIPLFLSGVPGAADLLFLE
jgi:hypothetical protein